MCDIAQIVLLYIVVLQYPDTNLERKTRQLIMENVSSLPLSMTLRLEYPFQFMPNDVAWEYQNSDVSVSVFLPILYRLS